MNNRTAAVTDRAYKAIMRSLERIFATSGRLAVALSGGVDSSLLLAACARFDPDVVLAVTCDSELMPTGETEMAGRLARDLGVRHIVIPVDPLGDPLIRNNPPGRCYHCRKLMFGMCLERSRAEGWHTLADGRIMDDEHEFRPGTRAALELGVASPLADAGIDKNDVRRLSRDVFGLSGWDKPAGPCLATRIPCGTPLTSEALKMVRQLEDFIRKAGFQIIRARVRGTDALIEAGPDEIGRLDLPEFRDPIVRAGIDAGFRNVRLAREPYRSERMKRV